MKRLAFALLRESDKNTSYPIITPSLFHHVAIRLALQVALSPKCKLINEDIFAVALKKFVDHKTEVLKLVTREAN